MSKSVNNKRDCVTTPPTTTGHTGNSTVLPPSTTAPSVADARDRLINSSPSEASNSQSVSLLASIKTTPSLTKTPTTASTTSKVTTRKSIARTSSPNQHRPSILSGKSVSRTSHVTGESSSASASSAAEEGGATIIRQATASSPTRTVKIPGLGSKLFKKCKSATFQIDGATYTIGKYSLLCGFKSVCRLSSPTPFVSSFSSSSSRSLKKYKWISR